MVDEMGMEMEDDEYGAQQMNDMEMGEEMEDEEDDNGDPTFEALRDIIEKTEDEGKDQAGQARGANYISKGTYIW
jgi:hypothetical protein